MKIHVLAGESLVEQFEKTEIGGEVVVCRECFVDGDLEADTLEEFWEKRERYLSENSQKEPGFYEEKVKDEFIRLWNLSDRNDVNLWFENELFCQVNLWFCLWLLRNTEARFNVIYPPFTADEDVWKGFAHYDIEALKEGYGSKVSFSHDDIYLGVQLWEAYQKRDFEKLLSLAETDSKCFPKLKEVCEAAAEIETRPKATLKKIIDGGKTEFGEAFKEFSEIEAIYGFGDLQVKRIFDELQG